MAIGEICNREVAYAERETTINAAAKLMRHYHVGSLVIVEDLAGKRVPVGIVTIDDLLEVLAEEFTDLTRVISKEQTREMHGRK